MIETDTEILATVEQLSTLVAAIDTAQGGVDDLASTATSTIEQVDTDWAVLEQRATAVLALVNSAQAKLTAESQLAETAVSELQESLESLQDQARTDYEGVETLLETCDQKIGAHQESLSVLAQAAADSLTTLQTQAEATETSLTEALTNSANSIQSELMNELTEQQTSIRDQVSTLQSSLSETCVPMVRSQVTDFTGQLDTVATKLTGRLEQLSETTTEKTMEALLPLEEVKAQYTLLMNNVNQLKQSVDSVVDRIDNVSDETSRALSLLEDAVEVTSIGALMVVGIMEDVKDLLT
ncbi:MAG: hypothetical protein AAFV85_23770 [Cyanobacteria bacterium J06634_6]